MLGSHIPYPLIEWSRRVLHFGSKQCPVCLGRVRKFHHSGYGYPVLEQLEVVGGMRRAEDRCPICHATSRERIIWFYLSDAGANFRFSSGTKIAHFAPEKGLTMRLLAAVGDGYKAYDFQPDRYRHLRQISKVDLHLLTLKDNSIDLLLCNHVLEHLHDPRTSAAEMFRVLEPGGTAIMQVPIANALDDTIELGSKSAPQDRIDQLGQDDHLRLYSRTGYIELLRSAGFVLTEIKPFETSPALAAQWQLDPLETLYLWRKPQPA